MERKLILLLKIFVGLCLIVSAAVFVIVSSDKDTVFVLFAGLNGAGVICYCLAFREFKYVETQWRIQSYVKVCLTASIVIFAIISIFFKNVTLLFLAMLNIGGVISYQYVLDDYDK
mgnify:CR=1 FL=1